MIMYLPDTQTNILNSYNTPNLCLHNPELQNYEHKKNHEQPWTSTTWTTLNYKTTNVKNVPMACDDSRMLSRLQL